MNKSPIRYFLTSAFLISFHLITVAQSAVVVKAMKDELKRNLENLRLNDHSRPFFIQYDLSDYFTQNFTASDGVLISYSIDSTRNTSVRLLVGDYDFNDESYDIQESYEDYLTYFPMDLASMGAPLGDDYYGIRSDFWKSTESVYRQAAKKFKKVLSHLNSKGKTQDQVLHRRFARVKPLTFISPMLEGKLGKEQGKTIVSDLSKRLMALKATADIRIMLFETLLTQYSINSEGNTVVESTKKYRLIATKYEEESMFNLNRAPLFQMTTDQITDLANVDHLFASIVSRVEKRVSDRKAINIGEEYDGPVLFIEEALGNALSSTQIETLLQASQTVDTTQSLNNYGYLDQSLEEKLGKRVSSKRLTLWALPTLKSYMGKNLSGAYQFDREGLKAPDSLILIESGILKNLTSQRNFIKGNQTANGTANGPGTLSFQLEFEDSFAELKEMLKELAEDEGLSYAIIAKSGEGSLGNFNFFRLDLETGKEELLKDVRLSNFSFNKLRKIKGASKEMFVYNSAFFSDFSFPGMNSEVSSFIYPKFVLIDGLDLVYQSDYRFRNQDTEPFPVPSPSLGKN